MRQYVHHAEATLGGRVGDWRVAAKESARLILELVAAVEEAERRCEQAAGSRQAEIDAARSRQQQAERAAARAASERDALAARLAAVEARLAHVVAVGADMAARLTRAPGGTLLARDSGGVVEKFQGLFLREVR